MPKISIALFGRNDNYVKNYLEIMKFSIRSIQRALENTDYEILLLDYNPPKDRPLLSECFPNNEYPRIKHVVFSHEDHLEFIDCHLKNGAKLKDNKGKIVLEKTIKKIQFIIAFAMNLSVKYSSGDYILSTEADIIFPIQFGKMIEQLELNILYRAWRYRIFNNIKKIEEISLSRFDKFSSYENIKDENKKYILEKKVTFKFLRKKDSTIWGGAGNFILMDRNSWKETGGYLPTINPRLPMIDGQIVFHALAYNKRIKSTNFSIYNIHGSGPGFVYDIWKGNSNYMVKNYNQKKEVGKNISLSGCFEWQRFRRWAIASHLEPDKEYFIKINYIKKLKKIKQLFKSFLPDKFLLY